MVATPDAALLEQQLGLVERSRCFRGSPRHRALLRHLVGSSQRGDTGALKESLIAVQVFGRSPADFDPRVDSIVRVESRRLRGRLDRFYASEGRLLPWRITLPVGGYVPALVPHGAAQPAATRQARDLLERGEHHLRQPLSQASLETARDRFQAALSQSPALAPAWIGLARAWLNLATGWYHDPAVATDHAAEALQQALALAPDAALAHTLHAVVLHQHQRDWAAARRSFRRALQLAPQQAFVHSAFGMHCTLRGEAAEAEALLQQARRLDPHYLNARVHLVNLRLLQRRFDAARAELAALEDLAGQNMAVHGLLGVLALLQGRSGEAVQHYQQACLLAPAHPNAQVSLAAALAADGRQAEADARVQAVLAPAADSRTAPPVSPYVLAVHALHSGRLPEAAALLRQALAVRDPSAVMLPTDPGLARLHALADWPALVATARQPVAPPHC